MRRMRTLTRDGARSTPPLSQPACHQGNLSSFRNPGSPFIYLLRFTYPFLLGVNPDAWNRYLYGVPALLSIKSLTAQTPLRGWLLFFSVLEYCVPPPNFKF